MIRAARRRAGFTQHALAVAARTSQPTIAAYEAGRSEPTVATLERLLAVCGLELAVQPAASAVGWTRAAARSLGYHQAVAAKLLVEPDPTIAIARTNLCRLRANDPGGHGRRWLDEWDRLLGQPVDELVTAMLSRSPAAIDLRQMTPFAGALTSAERDRATVAGTRTRVARAS